MSSLDWKEIEIVLRGKRVKGRYSVSEGLVTVAAWSGTNTAPLGILPAERLAKKCCCAISQAGNKKNSVLRWMRPPSASRDWPKTHESLTINAVRIARIRSNAHA